MILDKNKIQLDAEGLKEIHNIFYETHTSKILTEIDDLYNSYREIEINKGETHDGFINKIVMGCLLTQGYVQGVRAERKRIKEKKPLEYAD